MPARRPSAAARRLAIRAQTDLLARPEVIEEIHPSINKPPATTGRPAVVLMMGFPGVGKSHCARLLAARVGAAHVASDHLRSRLFVAASYAERENAAVFRVIDGLVERLLVEGHRVIVDATHLRKDTRRTVTAIAARHEVPLAHVLVVADEAETLARLARRAQARDENDLSEADERVYHAMRRRGFEEPDEPYLTLRNGPVLAEEIERLAMALGARWAAES